MPSVTQDIVSQLLSLLSTGTCSVTTTAETISGATNVVPGSVYTFVCSFTPSQDGTIQTVSYTFTVGNSQVNLSVDVSDKNYTVIGGIGHLAIVYLTVSIFTS